MERPNPFQYQVDAWLDAGLPASTDTPFLYHHLLEQTDLALIGHRPDGEVVYLNHAAAQLLGRRRRDVLSQPLWPLLSDEWCTEHQRMMQVATPTNMNFASELCINAGLPRYYSVFSTALFHSNGTLGVVWITLRDTTALHEAEIELKRANRQLRESNRDLEDFAYIASHDLQEPLRKIRTFGERLRTRAADDLDPKSLDYLDRMDDATMRMHRLINDLLAFSRVATKGAEFASIDLNDIVHGVLSDLEVAIVEADATINLGSLPTIEGDAMQFRQLFQNLIGNALKFADPDRPPEVWIDSAIFGGRWLFSVRDNGIGFDQKYAEKIFTVFQRLHSRTEYAGTGIGLSICRRIVERHDGTIRAMSEPGEGTTFLIDLPRTRADQPSLRAA